MNMMKKKHSTHPIGASRAPETPSGSPGGMWFRLFTGIMRGCAGLLVSGALLSFLGALIAYSQDDPDARLLPLSLAVLFLSLMAGGFIASRTSRQSPLLCGIGVGLMAFPIQFLLSCLLPDNLDGGWNGNTAILWFIRAGMLIFGLLGALLGGYAPRRRRISARRRHP